MNGKIARKLREMSFIEWQASKYKEAYTPKMFYKAAKAAYMKGGMEAVNGSK